jgi:tetratricopeptide (TPR) repeat protein
VTTWASLVQFLQWEKRYDEAIAACQAVSAHMPDQRAERRIGTLRIERGETEQGLAQMRQAVDAEPSVLSWVDLATTYMELERYAEAERCCKLALAAAQNDDDAVLANLTLFGLYRRTDRVSDALDAWSMAIVLGPELAAGVSTVYSWLIERGDLEQARRYLRRETNTMRQLFYQGVLHWAAGRENDARALWRRVLALDVAAEDADVEAWLEAALRVGEPQRILESEAQIARGAASLSSGAAIMLALAHSTLGNEDAAQDRLAEIIRHLDRGWPALEPIDVRRARVLRSLATQPDILEVLERISGKD